MRDADSRNREVEVSFGGEHFGLSETGQITPGIGEAESASWNPGRERVPVLIQSMHEP
jgi:hypothetical protein